MAFVLKLWGFFYLWGMFQMSDKTADNGKVTVLPQFMNELK